MRRVSHPGLVLLMSLVAVGLGHSVIASRSVVCRDASGTTRIELACEKSAVGTCASESRPGETSLIAAVPAEQPGPCEDEPIGEPSAAAKALTKRITIDTSVLPALVALLVHRDSFLDRASVGERPAARDLARPPGDLQRLRTVIILI